MSTELEAKHLTHLLRRANEQVDELHRRLAKAEVCYRQYEHAIDQIHALCSDAGIGKGNVVERVRQLLSGSKPQRKRPVLRLAG